MATKWKAGENRFCLPCEKKKIFIGEKKTKGERLHISVSDWKATCFCLIQWHLLRRVSPQQGQGKLHVPPTYMWDNVHKTLPIPICRQPVQAESDHNQPYHLQTLTLLLIRPMFQQILTLSTRAPQQTSLQLHQGTQGCWNRWRQPAHHTTGSLRNCRASYHWLAVRPLSWFGVSDHL